MPFYLPTVLSYFQNLPPAQHQSIYLAPSHPSAPAPHIFASHFSTLSTSHPSICHHATSQPQITNSRASTISPSHRRAAATPLASFHPSISLTTCGLPTTHSTTRATVRQRLSPDIFPCRTRPQQAPRTVRVGRPSVYRSRIKAFIFGRKMATLGKNHYI